MGTNDKKELRAIAARLSAAISRGDLKEVGRLLDELDGKPTKKQNDETSATAGSGAR